MVEFLDADIEVREPPELPGCFRLKGPCGSSQNLDEASRTPSPIWSSVRTTSDRSTTVYSSPWIGWAEVSPGSGVQSRVGLWHLWWFGTAWQFASSCLPRSGAGTRSRGAVRSRRCRRRTWRSCAGCLDPLETRPARPLWELLDPGHRWRHRPAGGRWPGPIAGTRSSSGSISSVGGRAPRRVPLTKWTSCSLPAILVVSVGELRVRGGAQRCEFGLEGGWRCVGGCGTGAIVRVRDVLRLRTGPPRRRAAGVGDVAGERRDRASGL